MTLGSICDGIGGWQLGAVRAGIEPVWSSEIDKYCMAITKRHFPDTVQLGDLNKITDAPKVDIITAGTPCQDLSIAGKRGGLASERSGLFFKAVELIRRIRPSYFVWENVPGAFSSNSGDDFRTVLEEIAEEPIPLPRHGWSNAGMVDGRKCQIAWRTLDAQYWGVPQRRKRIFLVADFAGRRAGEILFEREGVSRNIAAGEVERKKLTAKARNDTDCAIYDNHWKDARIKPLGDKAPTVSAMYGTGGLNTPLVSYCIQGNTIDRQLQNGANGKGILEEKSFTLNTIDRHAVSYGIKLNATCDNGKEIQPPLRTAPFACVAYSIRQNATSDYSTEKQPALSAKPHDMVAAGVVRRLTPLECERLQGLPDGWTEGISDTQRYKAIGNGMAQPIADWILIRIKEVNNHDDVSA